jgi:hypothetical protein
MMALAAAADQAPSPLPRKPWRLRLRGGALELLADPASVRTDQPEQLRHVHLACGAALFNLRLAIAHQGVRPDVTLLPEGDRSDLLARLVAGPAAAPSPVEDSLFLALNSRRIQGGLFTQPFVPRELRDHLAEGVVGEGACLVPVADGDALRSFDGSGAVELLVTPGDTGLDWLRAGQSLQLLLLTATTLWLPARFHTRVLEVGDLRDEVRRSFCPDGHPQVVLEFGRWAPPIAT